MRAEASGSMPSSPFSTDFHAVRRESADHPHGAGLFSPLPAIIFAEVIGRPGRDVVFALHLYAFILILLSVVGDAWHWLDGTLGGQGL